jgi:hypothetical protein
MEVIVARTPRRTASFPNSDVRHGLTLVSAGVAQLVASLTVSMWRARHPANLGAAFSCDEGLGPYVNRLELHEAG